VTEPPVTFAGLLRNLRTEAGLTQEELATAARLSPRSISDLERGINQTARKDTARLLAGALSLTGVARAAFEAIARGHAAASGYPWSLGIGAPAEAVAGAPCTLPRDITSFTGREPELRELLDTTIDTAGSGTVVGIHAIGGMAGVGKTAFAVHAAYRLAERFPAGQMFLPLHGHTPGQQPVDAASALATLLITAGVPVQQIPPGTQARAALWRDWLAGRRLILVLDDATDSEQVRPLLPGTGGSLVLVTSRRHLSALEDARVISLDILSPRDAAGLLVRLAAKPGLSADDDAVAELTRLCGYLPLAVGMLARQLHHHPAWTPGDLVGELAAARDRLELMATENLSVTAAFDLSYRDLSEEQQRLFRRLGLHPGAEIDAAAAAALNGISAASARHGLEALYNQYLLTELARGRYRMHDLIREHARALAARDDPSSERDHATSRLLDYYQHTAASAEAHLARDTRPRQAVPLAAPASVPDLRDSTRSLSWVRAERANLLACLDYVTRAEQHARVVAITASVAALLERDGPWPDAITRHATAVQAARHLGDLPSENSALCNLGSIRRLTGDYPAAGEALEAALDIARGLGDQLGQANALNNLGVVRVQTGNLYSAADAIDAALTIYTETGDQLGRAAALSNLGNVRRVTGDHMTASEMLRTALDIYHDAGDQLGEARVLNSLGSMGPITGDYPTAARALEAALDISRNTGDRLVQANVLFNLGRVRSGTGDNQGATEALLAALGIYRDIGDLGGQTNTFVILGAVRRQAGDYQAAIEALEEALSISSVLGNKLVQANALLVLGSVRQQAGDYLRATGALEAALRIVRDIGHRGGEAEVLNETGTLYRARGDSGQAEVHHRKALDVAREIESAWDEAQALAGLGRCALAAGDSAQAKESLGQALEIFQRIGAAEASGVSAELDALRTAGQREPTSP
jgi:tetratricopeptide (TPR) repeat protein/DNA-binding XRE family transcriptional regulator